MPVSTHWSQAFSSLSISTLTFIISPGESMAGSHVGLVRKRTTFSNSHPIDRYCSAVVPTSE
jgi:hypothetical protein